VRDEETNNDGPLPWGWYALFSGIIIGLLAGNFYPI
jgi:hypothetical protein